NVVGSNFLSKAEVDTAALRRAGLIVVDSKDQAHLEAGDLVHAIEQGVIHWSDIPELGAVIVGRARGRGSPQEVTMFKSLGIAIEDVAAGARVYALARQAGVGREIEWWRRSR